MPSRRPPSRCVADSPLWLLAFTYSNATPQVYFHVVRSGTSLSGGNVPQSQIQAQMNVLNADYAGTGLSFTLAGTDFTTNATWFNSATQGNSAQTAMKRALRTGGANALNVYTFVHSPYPFHAHTLTHPAVLALAAAASLATQPSRRAMRRTRRTTAS